MAPTEGRVAKSERRWDCHHGTPRSYTALKNQSMPNPTQSRSEAVFTANHLTDTDRQNGTGKYTN